MSLGHITDAELIRDTRKLISSENKSKTQFLFYLLEIDRRKLFSELRCSSLYDFCLRELGLSEASAHRRIQVARLLADVPIIQEKMQSGKISVMNLSLAASFFRQQKIQSLEQKESILNQLENLSKKECEKKLFEISGLEKERNEREERINKSEVVVSWILKNKTIEKINNLKQFLGNTLSSDDLLNLMIDVTFEKLEKKKFKVNPHFCAVQPPPVEVTGRYIPSELKRSVFLSDQKCVNCGSLFRLNIDHIKPLSLGGKTSFKNLRILCFNCNQRARINARL